MPEQDDIRTPRTKAEIVFQEGLSEIDNLLEKIIAVSEKMEGSENRLDKKFGEFIQEMINTGNQFNGLLAARIAELEKKFENLEPPKVQYIAPVQERNAPGNRLWWVLPCVFAAGVVFGGIGLFVMLR